MMASRSLSMSLAMTASSPLPRYAADAVGERWRTRSELMAMRRRRLTAATICSPPAGGRAHAVEAVDGHHEQAGRLLGARRRPQPLDEDAVAREPGDGIVGEQLSDVLHDTDRADEGAVASPHGSDAGHDRQPGTVVTLEEQIERRPQRLVGTLEHGALDDGAVEGRPGTVCEPDGVPDVRADER